MKKYIFHQIQLIKIDLPICKKKKQKKSIDFLLQNYQETKEYDIFIYNELFSCIIFNQFFLSSHIRNIYR